MLKHALLVIPILVGALVASSVASAEVPSRKIVVFRESSGDAVKEGAVRGVGGNLLKSTRLVNAAVAELTAASTAALALRADVLRVEEDVMARASVVAAPEIIRAGDGTAAKAAKAAPPAPAPAQTVPWGVGRIRAPQAWPVSRGTSVKVAAVDTGISTTHPDLRVAGGVNEVRRGRSYDDDNGHGSHVAGIIAASDDALGAVGVGPAISLYAVKVLDRNGSGWASDIIAGLDWSVANGMRVANMSLGMGTDVAALHDAIRRANAAGITLVAAAGNSGPTANSVEFPAAYPEVLAISAVNNQDGIASFSSNGPQVALAAPGAAVYSTYKGAGYATLSGTSMAAPHVAGVAALRLSIDPDKSPAHIASVLKANATSLPGLSSDQQGAGLVDAYNVVMAP